MLMDIGIMKNMRFSYLRRAPHEYRLVPIKRLVGGVEVVQGLFGIRMHGYPARALKFMTALKPLDLIKLTRAGLVNAAAWSKERQTGGGGGGRVRAAGRPAGALT